MEAKYIYLGDLVNQLLDLQAICIQNVYNVRIADHKRKFVPMFSHDLAPISSHHICSTNFYSLSWMLSWKFCKNRDSGCV